MPTVHESPRSLTARKQQCRKDLLVAMHKCKMWYRVVRVIIALSIAVPPIAVLLFFAAVPIPMWAHILYWCVFVPGALGILARRGYWMKMLEHHQHRNAELDGEDASRDG